VTAQQQSGELVIVGASLAGVRAAEAVREAGFGGRLTLVGAGPHFPPYDRPPLSKHLSSADPARLARIRMRDDLGAELVLGTRATGLDVADRRVILDDGSSRDYTGLVVTTGAAPRTLPDASGNVMVLRTVRDSARLAESLHAAGRGGSALVTVIGAGVLGCEIASACRGMGADVTMIDVQPQPMVRVVGTEVGRTLRDLHARNGIRLLLGRSVQSVSGSGDATVVRLADGLEIVADIVVACIGVVPNTDWLAGSGLTVSDGVVCDQWCFAEGSGRTVVAAGDVARWYHPLMGRQVRVEHWTNAATQGGTAARNLLAAVAGLGEPVSYDALPYAWSDQYGWKLQMLGVPVGAAEIAEGSMEDEKFVAIYQEDGQLTGALCVNLPSRLRHWRKEIIAAATRV
jgi:NADPH-dependent 2,4-dienoyl-CoA reductase/sulfur reductase-like enzyme